MLLTFNDLKQHLSTCSTGFPTWKIKHVTLIRYQPAGNNSRQLGSEVGITYLVLCPKKLRSYPGKIPSCLFSYLKQLQINMSICQVFCHPHKINLCLQNTTASQTPRHMCSFKTEKKKAHLWNQCRNATESVYFFLYRSRITEDPNNIPVLLQLLCLARADPVDAQHPGKGLQLEPLHAFLRRGVCCSPWKDFPKKTSNALSISHEYHRTSCCVTIRVAHTCGKFIYPKPRFLAIKIGYS